MPAGSLASQIDEARKQGYSDDEVISYLGTSHADLAPKIKEAKASGYGAGDILSHLSASAPRDPNELPGYKQAEDWAAEQAKKPAQSFARSMWESAKQLGSAAVSPITSLWDIPGALRDWVQKGFRPPGLTERGTIDPANYSPGGNPVTEAAGMLSGAALASLPAKEAAQAIARTPAAIVRTATSPGMPSIVGGAGEVMAGAGGLASGNPVGMAVGAGVGVRGAARIAKGLAERKAMLAERAVEETAARGKELAAEHRAGPQPTPAWQAIRDVQESPALDLSQAEVDALPAQMARDYLDANRIRRQAGMQKPPRAEPGWRAIQAVPEEAPAVSQPSPTDAALPSGRAPGGIANMKPVAAAEPIPAPEVAQAAGITLDGIAQGFGYKSFKSVKEPRAQSVIQSQYDRLVQQEVAKASVKPAQPVTPEALVPATTPVVESPAVTEVSAPPTTPTPPRVGGVKQIALDAKALTDKLVEWKLSPDEAAGMNRAGWTKLAFESGVPAPTAAVQAETVFNLKKSLQGSNRTASQLFEAFRAAGK